MALVEAAEAAVVACDIAAAVSGEAEVAVREESDAWMCAEGAPHGLVVESEARELVADAARTAAALPHAARALAAAAVAGGAAEGRMGEAEVAGPQPTAASRMAEAAGQAAGQAAWDMAVTLDWYLVGDGVRVALDVLMDHVADAVAAIRAAGGAGNSVAPASGVPDAVPAACPAGHPLGFSANGDALECDGCGRSIPRKQPRSSCTACDFDVCSTCAPPSAPGAELPPSPENARAPSRSQAGAAAAAGGSVAPASGLPDVVPAACPAGHPLEFSTNGDALECDGCGCSIPRKQPRSSCTACDFDICITCAPPLAPKAEPPPSPEAVPSAAEDAESAGKLGWFAPPSAATAALRCPPAAVPRDAEPLTAVAGRRLVAWFDVGGGGLRPFAGTVACAEACRFYAVFDGESEDAGLWLDGRDVRF